MGEMASQVTEIETISRKGNQEPCWPQDDFKIASERSCDVSTATTKKFYRSNVTTVTPLMSHKTQEALLNLFLPVP